MQPIGNKYLVKVEIPASEENVNGIVVMSGRAAEEVLCNLRKALPAGTAGRRRGWYAERRRHLQRRLHRQDLIGNINTE